MIFFVVCCRNEGESTDAGKDDGDSKSDKIQIFRKQIQLWRVAACDVSSSHISMPTCVSVKRYYYINDQILFYIEMLAWRTCIVIYSYPNNPHSIKISSEDHRQFDIKFNELILHVLRTQHLTCFSDAATEESMSVDEESSECYWWVSALNGSLCITLYY